ncbi:hypothetical protein B0H10DRAFT_1938479 [Mycena sp. CBHHK59/15]|nr:hypothetical protein B0H10DRAFT_1938479 [Mycena sp. CBHHK59/15]
MDARLGTSTGTAGAMNHSIHEPRSSSQDSAAESERRSRLADVDESNGHTDMDVTPISHHAAYQDGSVVSDDQTESHRTTSAAGDAMSDAPYRDAIPSTEDGFQTPKRTSRVSSARGSPVLDTTPKFFGDWFDPADNDSVEGVTERVKTHKNWADFKDDDGLGEIPSDWKIKDEPDSDVPLGTTSERSLSPIDSGLEFSFENVMREVYANLPKGAKDILARRSAKMRKARLKVPRSVSGTSSEKRSKHSDGVSIHTAELAEHASVSSKASQPSRAAASNHRIPAAAKGKGRDPREGPGITVNDSDGAESTPEDDIDREQRDQRDALLAMYLQCQLEKELDEQENMPIGREAGTSQRRVMTESDCNRAEREAEDQRLAEKLRRLYDEHEQRLHQLETSRPALTKPAEPRAQASELKGKPTAMDQIPKNSQLYRDMHGDTPDSSDSSSSSSSEDTCRKRKAKEHKPSDISSGDSVKTRCQKKRAKHHWRMKIFRFKLEQSQARPDPPFVYNGEANFAKFQKWQLEVRDWVKQSFIRRKMQVSWLKKYVGGRAETWYMRKVARNPEKCVGDDISDRQLVIRFWEGADVAIHLKWAEGGYDPESSTLNELETAAANYQRAFKIKKAQQSKNGGDSEKYAQKPKTEGHSNLKNAGGTSSKKGGNSENKAFKGRDQAQGKCFTCASTEHMSKDCPKRSQLKPKVGVASATVDFAEVERLRNLKAAQSLGIFVVDVVQVQPDAAHISAINEVLVAKMYSELYTAVPFVFDHFNDPDNSPFAENRFKIIETQLGWLICDRHTDDDHEVLRTQLLDSGFNFIEWLYMEKCKVEDEIRLRRDWVHTASAEMASDGSHERGPRDDIPDTFRQFMYSIYHDPDEPGMAEELINSILEDFRVGVPYSFDSERVEDREEVYSRQRFTLTYSERDFLLLDDQHMHIGYNLTYDDLLAGRWDASRWLEDQYATFEMRHQEPTEGDNTSDSDSDSDTSDWWDDDFNNNGPPAPPPPPPAVGLAAELDYIDSDGEGIHSMKDVSESESDDEGMPNLDDTSDSEDDDDTENSHEKNWVEEAWNDHQSHGSLQIQV